MKSSISTYKFFVMAVAVCFLSFTGLAQEDNVPADDTTGLVQMSGMVVTDEGGVMQALPYVNIYIEGSQRGTYSSNDGFFSLVGRVGETIIFSSVGFDDIAYVIPDTLSTDRYSLFQIMTRDTVYLPETVIYPWPSREHFKLEFLAMDIDSDLEDRLAESLSDKALAEMIAFLPTDGDENTDYFLREQAAAYYYEGQIKPQNVFNAFAWAEFIKALKRGDFKKKKK